MLFAWYNINFSINRKFMVFLFQKIALKIAKKNDYYSKLKTMIINVCYDRFMNVSD